MLKMVGHLVSKISNAFCVIGILSAGIVWASVGGSISGTIKDPSGRVVSNAEITIREVNTGLSRHVRTDHNGYYTLPALPVGRYELEAQFSGFRSYQRKNIVLDTNAALNIDASLELGNVDQTVSVNDNTLHVETISTQMGEVITGRQMTAVPLDGRSFTDLLSLQAGVAPATSITSSTVQDVGKMSLPTSSA